MAYRYQSNVSPRDRFDQLGIQLDNGSSAILRKGGSYDLSANELARARRYVVFVVTGSPADSVPVVTARLPVVGDMQDGQVPVWDASLGAFVPGDAATGGGGGDGNTRTLLWDDGAGDYDHPEWHSDTSIPRQFIGPVYPLDIVGITMAFGDTWTATEEPAAP